MFSTFNKNKEARVKNIIPVVVAALFGLAAVFAVSKTLGQQEKAAEKTKKVVIVTSEIEQGQEILQNQIGIKNVPVSAAPQNCIDAENASLTYHQRAKRAIAKNDYLLYTDLELNQSKSEILGDGQWGVTVTFADPKLVRMLQPGDDIAIIGTFTYSEAVKSSKNSDAAARVVSREITTVIYPRVSVLEINGSSVLLSLPPQQAIALTVIQNKAQLYPLLRKRKDDNALNRIAGGKFDWNETSAALAEGLQPINIPQIPSEITKVK